LAAEVAVGPLVGAVLLVGTVLLVGAVRLARARRGLLRRAWAWWSSRIH